MNINRYRNTLITAAVAASTGVGAAAHAAKHLTMAKRSLQGSKASRPSTPPN